MNNIILEQASDSDYILTAEQLQKSLRLLKNEGFCENIKPRNIESDNDGGWSFAEYTIDSEEDKLEVEKFIEYCKRIIFSTIYRGELSHNVINNRRGILYLFPENTGYSSNDMEYYKSVFCVRENVYMEESKNNQYTYKNISTKRDIEKFVQYSRDLLNDENISKDAIKRSNVKKIYYKNKFIGYIGLTSHHSDKDGKYYLSIRNFIILPEYQSSGHGSNIINEIINENQNQYDEIFCWVKQDNIDAIRFYQRLGYVNTERLLKGNVYYVCFYKKSDESVREDVNLTKFTWYHAEIKRDGFNPKKAGGWDEELYSKNIESCIHNDIEYDYHFKGKDKTEAYLYTAGEGLSPIYLGIITVYRTDKGVDWEWSEQETFSSETISYLKNKVQKHLLEDSDVKYQDDLMDTDSNEIEEWSPTSFLNRRSKPAKNQRAHKYYLKRKQKKDNHMFFHREEALSSKERKGLDDSDFGIPELRKYPIHDKRHVEQAVKMFNHVDKEYEKQLATRLLKAMRKFGVSTDSIGEKNRLRSYISESYIYESGNEKRKIKPIFIVNSFTNTPFGKVISVYTHNRYSHSAISFDAGLETLYTFNADAQRNIFGGISIESISGYIKQYNDSSVQVNCLFVKESDYDIIQKALTSMLDNKSSTKYGYNNIINILLNKSKQMGEDAMSMVCSQFVGYLLSKANIDLISGKSINLITPKDLSNIQNPKVYKMYEGYARLYDKKSIDRLMRKVTKKAEVIKEYSINL